MVRVALLSLVLLACSDPTTPDVEISTPVRACPTSTVLPARLRVESPQQAVHPKRADVQLFNGGVALAEQRVALLTVGAPLASLANGEDLQIAGEPLAMIIALSDVAGTATERPVKGYIMTNGTVHVDKVCATGVAVTLQQAELKEYDGNAFIANGCSLRIEQPLPVVVGNCPQS